MTTDFADEKLKRWGEFTSQREQGVMGYPGFSPTFRLEASGGGTGSVDLVDTTVLVVDRIIAAIKQDKPELFIVAVGWYVFNDPVSTIARRSHCCRDTVYSRLNALKARVRKGLEQ